jgi:hypothetical protein
MKGQRNSWGSSLFCDDIRQEIAGKVSLIGVYGSDMILPVDFPATAAKLCVHITYVEVTNEFQGNLSLKISMKTNDSDNLIHTEEIARQDIISTLHPNAQLLIGEDGERVNILRFHVVFTPLPIPEECFIKVRMTCGDVVTKMGALWIRKLVPTDNLQLS